MLLLCPRPCFWVLVQMVVLIFLQQSNIAISSTVKIVTKKKRRRLSKNGTVICVLNGVDEGTWLMGRVKKLEKNKYKVGLSH